MALFPARRSHPMGDPNIKRGEYRFSLRYLLFITAVFAALFGAWKAFSRYETPPTVMTRWTDSSGGYIQYGVSDKDFACLFVSMLPEHKTHASSYWYTTFGITREFFYVFGVKAISERNDIEIQLGRHPTIILMDDTGTVHSGPCPVNRQEFQQLIDALNNAPVDPKAGGRNSIALTKEFVRSFGDREWPAAVRTILLDE